MKISEILKKSSRGVSFEFFPPKTKKGEDALVVSAQGLKKYNPLYASMTCGAGGSTQDRTKGAVSALLKTRGLTVMPHLTCVDSKEEAVKEILEGYKSQGIENIMALRGDPPEGVADSLAASGDFNYALDLVNLIKDNSHFCIGVAVYPEGHIETSSFAEDMDYAKQKIDAGADFAVTQMFFDNVYYYSLLERMKKKGINIPVLPGILPLTDVAKVRQFSSVCRATIPKYIEEKMERFRQKPEDMQKVGIDFTIEQCRGLLENGIERLHFFTLNKYRIVTSVIEGIGL